MLKATSAAPAGSLHDLCDHAQPAGMLKPLTAFTNV